jgi:hypothetical protein
VTFSGGKAHDLGHLTRQNLAPKWREINFQGHTEIMPGWKKLLNLHEHHHTRSHELLLFALVITDGVADDTSDFEEHLMTLHGRVFVVLAILGFGDDHDKAVREYKAIEGRNTHLRVVLVQDAPNQGKAIADALQSFFYTSRTTLYVTPTAPTMACVGCGVRASRIAYPCMHVYCEQCSAGLYMTKRCSQCTVDITEVRLY